MDKTAMKLWYDPEADFLEVIFDRGVGVAEDTEDERVEVRVDKHGRVLSFHILGLKSTEGAPFEVELKPKKKTYPERG
ncbi:MAG TPA: DUF2283 domain-containing protein [Dehalococcoidia bacterium]|jgi:uncharacterized protein YuzE|nr:DUF2283 domain-containing protein [Dehalococcoidia bacterium]